MGSTIYAEPVDRKALLGRIPPQEGSATLEAALREALAGLGRTMVVLDDDPTGSQTVHDVSVYTTWDEESIAQGFAEAEPLFFVLTNSRGLSAAESRRQHTLIAANVVGAARRTGRHYLLVSRSDSTLRGHYPLETATLRTTIEGLGGGPFDGEIIVPFFCEGERYTIDDTHFIGSGDRLTPAHLTESARDPVFGYHHSHLPSWVEEKTSGEFPASSVRSIGLPMIRRRDTRGIAATLCGLRGFAKIIVNAVEYDDLKVFAIGFAESLRQGSRFIVRSAASFVRVMGGITPRDLLQKSDLVDPANTNGGLVVVGSHVPRSTEQLAAARDLPGIVFLEVPVELIDTPDALRHHIDQAAARATESLARGIDTVIYTSRRLMTGQNAEENMRISAAVSDCLVRIVRGITARPKYVVGKGGITSSDIGTRALGVRKARVLGQALPGVPVWLTDAQATLPGTPYIIFPGNVGGPRALRELMEKLR